MGFGSYDETEQREVEADFDDEDAIETQEHSHKGTVEFENGASNEELINRLHEIKEDEDTEENGD